MRLFLQILRLFLQFLGLFFLFLRLFLQFLGLFLQILGLFLGKSVNILNFFFGKILGSFGIWDLGSFGRISDIPEISVILLKQKYLQ